MKSLFIIILTFLAFSQCSSANTNQSISANLPVPDEGWKAVSFDRAGLTMNIPAEFIDENWRNEPDDKDGSKYSKTWKIEYQNGVEVNVTISDNFLLPNKSKTSSPEEKLKSAFQVYSKNTTFEDTKYFDLNGIKGIFTRSPNGGDKINTKIRWVIYRFYQGQAQEFQINVNGKKGESEKLMKVFDSVRLANKKIEIDKNEELGKADKNGWRTEKIESADLTINIPSEFKHRNFSGDIYRNKNITAITHQKTWRISDDELKDHYISVETTDWEKDFPPDERSGKIETPEEAIETEYFLNLATQKYPPVTESERKVDEVKYLEIDGLKGAYISIKNSVKDNKLEIVWTSFRRYNNNGQKILVSITGKPADRKNLEKVLASIKFTKK